MITWHVGKKVEVVQIKNPPPDVLIEICVSRYEGTKSGYTQYDISMSLKRDGAVTLSDQSIDGAFIYLYPEQVKELKKLLKVKHPIPLRGTVSGQTQTS